MKIFENIFNQNPTKDGLQNEWQRKSNANFIRRTTLGRPIKTRNMWQFMALGERRWVYCYSENVSQQYEINSTSTDNSIRHLSSLDSQGQAIWTSPVLLGLEPGLCTGSSPRAGGTSISPLKPQGKETYAYCKNLKVTENIQQRKWK